MKVASLIYDDFDDLEFWYPTLRLREAGFTVDIVGEKAGVTYHGKYGVPAVSDYPFDVLGREAYDGVVVPGGWAPDKLRRFDAVKEFIRGMNQRGAVIGEICHAGWVLISAGILNGRTVTSTPGIRDDMENAGATWVDEPVVTDGNIVSSRRPPDLPDYTRALLAAFAAREQAAR